MFEDFTRAGQFLGFALARGAHFFFFGAAALTRETLPQVFPQYNFCFLRQVHGVACVEGDPTRAPDAEADAQFTAVKNRALVVQSADCLPLLLAGPTQIAALHAGWRGVEQNIVGAVRAHLPDFQPTCAALGPHIGPLSFEVGADVATRLLGRPVAAKCLVNLQDLARAQLRRAFPSAVLEACAADTRQDPRFCSFRRAPQSAGRNLSFVVINS